MNIQAISACPGIAWTPGSGWAAPIQSESTENADTFDTAGLGSIGLKRLAARSARRRARTEQGTFQGDDPATPDINEAYEAGSMIDREN